jgi:hypothetical protein
MSEHNCHIGKIYVKHSDDIPEPYELEYLYPTFNKWHIESIYCNLIRSLKHVEKVYNI